MLSCISYICLRHVLFYSLLFVQSITVCYGIPLGQGKSSLSPLVFVVFDSEIGRNELSMKVNLDMNSYMAQEKSICSHRAVITDCNKTPGIMAKAMPVIDIVGHLSSASISRFFTKDFLIIEMEESIKFRPIPNGFPRLWNEKSLI